MSCVLYVVVRTDDLARHIGEKLKSTRCEEVGIARDKT